MKQTEIKINRGLGCKKKEEAIERAKKMLL